MTESQTVTTTNFEVKIVEIDGTLKVYAHRIVDGLPHLPLAYMLGSNALIFEPPKKRS